MKKQNYTPERTATNEIIARMLKENTGRGILDSGDYYGRHWQRNAVRSFENEPDARATFDARGGGEILVYVSLYHFLTPRVTYLPELDKQFHEYATAPERAEELWEDSMESFVKSVGGNARYAFYTYNFDNMVDQDFICSAWNDKDGNALCFLQSHNGCDARGGFSTPHIFSFNFDYGLYQYNEATITCKGAHNHYWDYDGRFFQGESDKLDDYKFVDIEDTEFTPTTLSAYAREYAKLAKGKRLRGMPDASPAMHKLPGVIVSDKKGYCPICGSELVAYAPVAG